jgi:hypothetical protein
MNFFKKSLLALTLCAAGVANASVVDFNTNADNAYFSSSVTSQGFNITPNTAQDYNIGTMSNFDGNGMSNGSIYLGLWSNTYAVAAFTMTSVSNALFSLQSFDLDNGYQSNTQRTSSITIVGTLANKATVSETFSNLASVVNFQTYLLNSSFQGLTSATFTVSGDSDVRALFDNLVVNTAAVPEPGSLALLGLGIFGLAAARKKKQA